MSAAAADHALQIPLRTVNVIITQYRGYPDSKVHVANMGPTWDLSAPDGPHVGPTNLAIRVVIEVTDLALTISSHTHTVWAPWGPNQLGRSPKVVALFSAINFSSYIIELLQLHDTIRIEWNYAWIHYNIAIRSHLMI